MPQSSGQAAAHAVGQHNAVSIAQDEQSGIRRSVASFNRFST